MKTSIQRTEAALQEALSNPAYKVIALTGRWGTGKTFLWQRLCAKPEKTIEISAFGAKNVDDIKIKLLQSSIGLSTKNTEAMTKTLKPIMDITKRFFGWNVTDTLLVALPVLLKSNTIVIDDVERKNKSFEIGDLLGLVDEFTKRYEAKFLLILNTDNVTDKELWQSLHEKIIDKEIVLDPTPEDSFSIAIANSKDVLFSKSEQHFINFQIKNIRVIRKTLQVVREILGPHDPLPDPLYDRVIPSVVFLGICHFRGFNNQLDLDYVADKVFNRGKTGDNPEWNEMIRKAGIRPDKLTEVTIDYLKLGVANHEELTAFLDPLRLNTKQFTLLRRIEDFIQDLYWDSRQSADDVRLFVKYLEPDIYAIDSSQLSHLYNDLCKHDHQQEADYLVASWLEHAKKDDDIYNKLEYLYCEGSPKQLVQFKEGLIPPEEKTSTLKDAVLSFSAKSELSQQTINTLLNSTQKEYEELLQHLDKQQLKETVELHFRLGTERGTAHWQFAHQNFLLACKSITTKASKTKLAQIIKRELTQRKVLEGNDAGMQAVDRV